MLHIDCYYLKCAACTLTSPPQLQTHLEVQQKPFTGLVQHEVEVREEKSCCTSIATTSSVPHAP
jgi:hypothetical protein